MGEEIGFIYSVIWIVMSMMLGFRLLRFSSVTMAEGMNALNLGKLSLNSFRGMATSYMLGAILLIIPGVFSDFLGLILVFYAFYLQFIAKITPEQTNTQHTNKGNENENIIDVEIIDERSSSDNRS